MTQPYIDCAVRLARHEIDISTIREIVCKVGEGTVHRLWAPLDLKQSPPTPYAAKFSGPYTVAAGLVYGDAGLAEFTETALADPRIRMLATKIRYVVDPENPYPASYTGDVEITFNDGRRLSEHQPQLRGGIAEPMPRADLIAKCRANLSFGSWEGIEAEKFAAFGDALFENEAPFTARSFAR